MKRLARRDDACRMLTQGLPTSRIYITLKNVAEMALDYSDCLAWRRSICHIAAQDEASSFCEVGTIFCVNSVKQ